MPTEGVLKKRTLWLRTAGLFPIASPAAATIIAPATSITATTATTVIAGTAAAMFTAASVVTATTTVSTTAAPTTTATEGAFTTETTPAAATWRTFFTGACNIDRQRTTAEVLAIKHIHRPLSFFGGAEFYKCKAPGTPGDPIHHQIYVGDDSGGAEKVLEITILRLKGQIAHIEPRLGVHNLLNNRLTQSPNRR